MALLAVATSGCGDAGDRPAAGAPPSPTPAAPAPQALPGEGSPAMVLTGCAGLRAFTDYPQATAPGSAPPGWEHSPAPVVSVGTMALACQRIAVGPFERGPVHLVLDWHDGALAPPACLAGADGLDGLVLGNVLVDDPDVAAFLRQEHGMPARDAVAAAAVVPAAAADIHDWRWTAAGADGGESTLAVEGDPAVGTETMAFRLFWPTAQGLGVLDVEMAGTGPVGDRAAVGRLAPPMLAGDFAGLGQWLPAVEASARFGGPLDTACGGAP